MNENLLFLYMRQLCDNFIENNPDLYMNMTQVSIHNYF